jgi:mono/diheme cytochrome c family protein
LPAEEVVMRHRSTLPRTALLGLVASTALALVALVALAAPGDSEPPPYSPYVGGRTFATYCANCHGVAGEGDGYIADTLKVKPADLTTLAARNGGEFPTERVMAAIDGEAEVRAHGQRDMPVWGDVFLWPEGDTPERREQVRTKIGELVEYLRTIQKP